MIIILVLLGLLSIIITGDGTFCLIALLVFVAFCLHKEEG